jgi:hypothetical protein
LFSPDDIIKECMEAIIVCTAFVLLICVGLRRNADNAIFSPKDFPYNRIIALIPSIHLCFSEVMLKYSAKNRTEVPEKAPLHLSLH